MIVAVSVSPSVTGSFAAIPAAGVSWYLPPRGISTVADPIVLSNLSIRPFLLQQLRSVSSCSLVFVSTRTSASSPTDSFTAFGSAAKAFANCCAPLVFRKSLLRSRMHFSLQYILTLFVSVTSATVVASRFSSAAYFMNSCSLSASTTTAILSCDSEIASSVPSRPSYFFGTRSRLISRPSASSPIATDTPPAPKSLQRFISVATSFLLKSLCMFRSTGGLPFWTSAPHCSIDSSVCSLDEPVAPPHPSRPVLPPTSIITSPF